MPCLEITLPRVDDDTRQALAAELNRAFVEATGFPGDIFGVRFFQYEVGEVSAGDGKIWNGEGHPYLHMLLYCPRLGRAAKQKAAELLTRAFSKAAGNEGWKPVLHICEHPYDNVAIEGKLLSELFPELAQRKFYYSLEE